MNYTVTVMQRFNLVLLSCLICASLHAQVTTGTDELARLPYWQWSDDTVSLRFVQRLPDQTRAYFAGRGFGDADVKLIAGHCIFQTVFKNVAPSDSKQLLEYDIETWHALADGKQVGLKTREAWQKIWNVRNTDTAQKIAFEWSLLPTRQRYLPADYNWGMAVLPLSHGTEFDLVVSWQVDGKPIMHTFKNMQCARDVQLAPAGNN